MVESLVPDVPLDPSEPGGPGIDSPDVPLDPDNPLVPDVPAPEVPDDPDVPDVPEPLVPLDPDVPLISLCEIDFKTSLTCSCLTVLCLKHTRFGLINS